MLERRMAVLRTGMVVAVLIVGSWGGARNSWGANGDVVFETDTCATSGAAIDLCLDSLDGTLWQADRFSGELCQYSLSPFPPDIVYLNSIPHPFGPAAPFIPLITGIAFRPVSNTLLVYNSSTSQLAEVNKLTGALIGSFVTITPPDRDANLTSMTFDTIGNVVWFLDARNGKLLRYSLTGTFLASLDLPRIVPGERLYGRGVAFVDEGGTGFLDVTYGTTLDFAPVKVIRLDLAGNRTGHEVDLSQVPEEVKGIASTPGPVSVVYACSDDSVFKIDGEQPVVLPVTGLTCFSKSSGAIELVWENHGPFASNGYSVLTVVRPGLTQVLTGNVTSFFDTSPPVNQFLTYEVTAFVSSDSTTRTCSVHSGKGALIDYTPFPGVGIYDIASNPVTNHLYATDTQGGDIIIFDVQTLTVVDVFDVSADIPSPRGIAYNAALNRLVVGAANSSLLRLVEPSTGTVLLSVPTPSSRVGALTYDVLRDDYLYLDPDSGEVVRVEADPTLGAGQLIESCVPPGITGLEYNQGLTMTDDGAFIATVKSAVNQVNAGAQRFNPGAGSCFPTSPSLTIDLGDIGGSEQELDGELGIEVVDNLFYVAGGATNTIFRFLLAPTGGVFIRGDANGDGGTPNLTDALFIAAYTFEEGAAPECLDAADANDDGFIDISDPLYLIIFQFLMGPEPPAPYPTPGTDPTFLDPLDC